MNTDGMRSATSLAILIMLLCMVGLSYWICRDVKHQAVLFREDSLRKLTYSSELNSYQAEAYALLLQAIAAETPQKCETYKAEEHGYSEKIDDVLKEYEVAISSNQNEIRRAFDEFVTQKKRYGQAADQIWALLGSGQTEEARRVANTTLVAAYQRYTKAGDVLFDYDVSSGNQHARQIERAAMRAQLLTIFICVAMFFVGALTSFIVFRSYVAEGSF